MKRIIIAVDDSVEATTPFEILAEILSQRTNEEVIFRSIAGVLISESFSEVLDLVHQTVGDGENILHGFLLDIFDESVKDKNAGFELCRKIKDNPITSSAKVVCMTSRFFEIDKTAFEDCGADELIQRGGVTHYDDLAIKLLKAFGLTDLES